MLLEVSQPISQLIHRIASITVQIIDSLTSRLRKVPLSRIVQIILKKIQRLEKILIKLTMIITTIIKH